MTASFGTAAAGGNGSFTHRPTLLAPHAAIAAGHPLAAQAGLRVLQDGGNAVDAAVAAAGVLSVVLPDMCGLGGDAFALVWDPRTGRVSALNGSGRAPHDLGAVPRARPPLHAGPAISTVPGAVRAWSDLLDRFGSRPLGALLAPAIEYAGDGFPLGRRLVAEMERFQHVLTRSAETARVFLPGGRVPRVGELLRQEDLAASLRAVAEGGADALYDGPLGERISRWCSRHGGHVTAHDLGQHRSAWLPPLMGSYRGLDLYVSPPVSQALLVPLQAAILAHDDLAALGHNSADAVHLMVEAKRLAFADRDAHLGDPEFVPAFPAALLGPAHGRQQRARILRHRVLADAPSVAAQASNTTYLAVVDRDGMAVSFIQSIFGDFGCGTVAGDTGIVLNDRLLGFSWDPTSPNRVQPGKRPSHTLSPCLALDRGKLRLVVGTPGADAQVQTIMQLLVNLLDLGMDPQQAVEAPRWRGGAGHELLVERRLPEGVAADLARRGHAVVWGEAWDRRTGGAQMIMVDPRSGVLQAAADPRREGQAVGY